MTGTPAEIEIIARKEQIREFFKDSLQKNPKVGSVAMQAIRIDIPLNYFAEIILCALSVLGSNVFSFALQKFFYHKVTKSTKEKYFAFLK